MSKPVTLIQLRRRRFSVALLITLVVIVSSLIQTLGTKTADAPPAVDDAVLAAKIESGEYRLAIEALGRLAVRERVDRTGYARDKFSSGWAVVDGCDMRNRILQRDLVEVKLDEDNCTVLNGLLENDPFSGKRISFERGRGTSGTIHIEHIVAVSDAWQKGAQDLTREQRHYFYNDPLNLLAIDGPTNMKKGDKDAAAWMPRKAYRCMYVARQIAIKLRHTIWVTPAEHHTMEKELQTCPKQVLPVQEGT